MAGLDAGSLLVRPKASRRSKQQWHTRRAMRFGTCATSAVQPYHAAKQKTARFPRQPLRVLPHSDFVIRLSPYAFANQFGERFRAGTIDCAPSPDPIDFRFW